MRPVALVLLLALPAAAAGEAPVGTFVAPEVRLLLEPRGDRVGGWLRWLTVEPDTLYSLHPVAGRVEGPAFVGEAGASRWRAPLRLEPLGDGQARLTDGARSLLVARAGLSNGGRHPWLGGVLARARAAGDLGRLAPETWALLDRDLLRVRLAVREAGVSFEATRIAPTGRTALARWDWADDGRLLRVWSAEGDLERPDEHEAEERTPDPGWWDDAALPLDVAVWLLPPLARHLPPGGACFPFADGTTLQRGACRATPDGDGLHLLQGRGGTFIAGWRYGCRADADGVRVVAARSAPAPGAAPDGPEQAVALPAAAAAARVAKLPPPPEVRAGRDVEAAVASLRSLAHGPLRDLFRAAGPGGRAFRPRGYRLELAGDGERWIAIVRPTRPGLPHLALGADGLLRRAAAETPLDPAVLDELPLEEP